MDPGVESIPYNRQQPRARVATFESAEVLERAQVGFLHNIFSISFVASKPASEIVCRVEMR
jgi:hypothetical protein